MSEGTVKKIDPFRSLVLHNERFDWSDKTLTADKIGATIMGSVAHWNDPMYIVDDGFGNRHRMEPMEIEKKILFDARRPNWSGTSLHGKPYYQHMLTLGALMFPECDITPALADQAMFLCMCVGEGNRQILNLIGSQNCLSPEVEVRMHDGSVKKASEVVMGDLLMGQDSLPRKVVSLCSGEAPMIEIRPKVGRPFKVTENHLVTVVCKRGKKSPHGNKGWVPSATPGKLYDIPAKELSKWPSSKLDSYGLLTPCIEYPEAEQEIDPYIYGMWLGDGTSTSMALTSADDILAERWTAYFEGKGFGVSISTKKGTPAKTHHVIRKALKTQKRNPMLSFVRRSTPGGKRILREYLVASVDQRKLLLAGLIDTDGFLEKTAYEIACSYPDLAKDIVTLAESLGFRVSKKRKKTNYTRKSGEPAWTEVIRICGDIHTLPVLLPRKKKTAPEQGRGVRKHGVTGFTVHDVGRGPYAGFEVDGDHRFLLGDYTLTHNSGKSFGICFLSFVAMYIDPEYTMVFVANPYDKSSESQEWGTTLELWSQLAEAHPHPKIPGANTLFPNGKVYADRYLELIPSLPKAGRMELRGVKQEGKYRGTKQFGKDTTRGMILLNVGEVNLIENFAFMDMTDNLKSQPGFMAMTSQNFKDVEDQGGRLTEPVEAYEGCPATFDDLDIEHDQWWHSARASVTLRLDGHKSPNVLLGRDIYPKLFTLRNLETQKAAGVQSPSYYSQVRSFPIRGDEANSVLSRGKISASRHKDRYHVFTGPLTKVAFCDPAFGGRDSAVFGWCEFGTATVTDGDGVEQSEEIMEFRDFFRKLRLVNKAWYPGDDDYWKKRMEAAGISTAEFSHGAELSNEIQIAVQCREMCIEHKVPFANFGYDFSMRPDIVSAINQIVGFNSLAFDYNQGPEGITIQNLKKESVDACKDRITELAFLAADFFLTRQVRGGSFIETAITQLSRTQYRTINKKFAAEKKVDYKARWTHSPDHRDVLMGLAGMAVKRGFRAASVGKAGPKGRSAWAELNARKIGARKVFHRR